MSPAATLRALLARDQVLTAPTCFDALSARITREAGFEATFMSGFAVAGTRLGMPDTGLISFGEMVDQLRNICNAVPGLPVIADGDTGFGNAMNVRRTVTEYARAGAACVMIEDQVAPKRCGHFEGKEVISREEARMKVRAAVDAARDADILVLARTDARAVHGFDAAMERCRDFEDEGADIVFLEAPQSEDELSRFVRGSRKPTMANMVAGGKTPLLTTARLNEIGIGLAIHHPLLFTAVKAMQLAAAALKSGNDVGAPPLASFDEVKRLVGLPQYTEDEQRYAATPRTK
jgi:2-methylisocitrate lyase-like PEP mutase family enzyme